RSQFLEWNQIGRVGGMEPEHFNLIDNRNNDFSIHNAIEPRNGFTRKNPADVVNRRIRVEQEPS
ncbi:MAG: hypothetical protein ABIO24_13450, partial [Saprospiraceae bacterium]